MVTIKDVAKIAGVSMTTVSRAFNPKAVIKQDTRDKIMTIAKEIGYVPNYNARSLVTHRKFAIGLFFSSLQDGTSESFLSATIASIYEALPENFLLTVNDVRRINSFDGMVKNRMDGVLVVSQSERDNDFIYQLKRNHVPMVVINRYLDDPEIVNVSSDDMLGVSKMIAEIAKAGHKRVGMIEGIPSFASSVQRRQGFDEGVRRYHLTAVPEAIRPGDYSSQTGQAQMAKILALPENIRPTCVVCANDDTAVGALRACYLAGINVPQDMSVVGFDDSLYAAMSVPALTTVKKPITEMAHSGIQKLIALIDGENVDVAHREKIEPRVILRESVAQLN
ncbi:LacI family DNA-binding transcriptional regulator [Lacticaseibacillus jixiensis]|uniref:LacI family DNA-binding transcriptional regulator n=1 Tax=Lacticaseibacillus jixiensis TaxID=3231926 RepID=UPI0036F20E84